MRTPIASILRDIVATIVTTDPWTTMHTGSNVEIERKFLVKGTFPRTGKKQEIKQGYISTSPSNRVQVSGGKIIFISGGKPLFEQPIGQLSQAILEKIKNDGEGNILTDSRNVVRIRVKNNDGYITLKGPSSTLEVPEFEFKIPRSVAELLLSSMSGPFLSKVRYMVPYEGHTFEVDEFINPPGITVAEIELSSVDENFKSPPWLGLEVTGNPKYYNSEIVKNIV